MSSTIRIIPLIALILFTNVAFADVYYCDGVWTDRTCVDFQQPTTEESFNETPDTKIHADKDSKQLLVQDLITARYNAKRDYKVDFSTLAIEEECLKPEVTLKRCDELVRDGHSRLLVLISNSEKADDKVPDTTKTENNYNTNVIIINNDYERRRPIYKPNKPSTHKPGPFEGYRSRFK